MVDEVDQIQRQSGDKIKHKPAGEPAPKDSDWLADEHIGTLICICKAEGEQEVDDERSIQQNEEGDNRLPPTTSLQIKREV